MIALDANVISELMRDEPERRVEVWIDQYPASSLAVPAVALAELRYGVRRLPAGSRQDRLEVALSSLVSEILLGGVPAFDEAAAEAYAYLLVAAERKGRALPTADAQIAAICLSRGLTLATRNTRDFAGTGVELANPWSDGR